MSHSTDDRPIAGEDHGDDAAVDAFSDEEADGRGIDDIETDEDEDAAEDDEASFAVQVGTVADYLEDNAAALFEEAIGLPMDPDDPAVEKLVLGVLARYHLDGLQREAQKGKGRKTDVDKLAGARSLVEEGIVAGLRRFSGGNLKEISWRGPADEELLAFAYAVVAAWQVGATADALLDMELGLDPDLMDKLSQQLGELSRRRAGEASAGDGEE